MPKPDAQLVLRASNVVIIAGNGANRERQMVREDEDAIPDSHLVGEGKVIPLRDSHTLWIREHEIARFAFEVETYESHGQAARSVFGRLCGRIGVKLHSPVCHRKVNYRLTRLVWSRR